MDSSPAIPTDMGQMPTTNPDMDTVGLNIRLNSVDTLTPQPTYARGDRLATPDQNYNNVIFQVPVDNQVSVLSYHYESPNIPVTQLPFSQAIHNSMFPQPQTAPILIQSSLRAPSINEGY